MRARVSRLLVLGIVVLSVGAADGRSAEPVVTPVWSELDPLPDPSGYAGLFAGVSGDGLMVAGGASFADGSPWGGGRKRWHDRVFRLADPEGDWEEIGVLPRPLAYGVSVSWGDEVICIGGADAERHYAEVLSLRWDGRVLTTSRLPSLPMELANAVGVLQDGVVYVAGGSESPAGATASAGFWELDLRDAPSARRWVTLPSWPGPGRVLPVMASQAGKVLLVGGVGWAPDGQGGVTREFLRDAYAYDLEVGTWSSIRGPPKPMVGAPNPGISLGHADVLFLAGDESADLFHQGALSDLYPGFAGGLQRYNLVTDRWTELGWFPPAEGVSLPVTAPVVAWRGRQVIPGGEIGSATGTPRVWAVEFTSLPAGFGVLNWVVVMGYLGGLVVIGIRCSRRESGTENFLLGGRRIPWWAAGLSLFVTLLSAITFLAVPARAYATDWTLLPINLCVLAVAPVIVFKYMPALRRHRVTTLYEYLAIRFDRSIQLFGSASFILFQLGRMGIVLLLPALALSAVTGIDLYLGIVLMGVLATVYTVLGGIEAVVWTDVLQTVVLLGGAIVGLVLVIGGLDGGVDDLVRVAAERRKFHWVNLDFSLVTDSFVVVLLGGLFSNALVPYSSDQAVVQRYLVTPDEGAARRSIWLGALLVLPATLLFLLLGTGLFVYFTQHPDRLAPLEQADQILPWFIATQMPAGLAGLLIAGVFAAAMSSLDSSMHSIATTVVTDWLPGQRAPECEGRGLRCARWVTLAAGLCGTATAVLLAGMEIRYLWDFFLGLLGLIGGTLGGVMAAAVFLPSARARHLWPAIVVSVGVLFYLKFCTPVNGLLLGFVGVAIVFLWVAIATRVRPRG